MQRMRIWRHFDVWLLAAVAMLTIAGIAMIRSAIAGNETLLDYPTRQSVYALIGLTALLILTAIDYRLWAALARPIYLVVVGFLGLILISGIVGFGSARWFSIGVATVQPSEISKIGMILVLANFIAKYQDEINQPGIILRSLMLIGLPMLLIFIQPDLSTAIVLAVIWLAMVWAAGINIRYLATMAAFAIATPFLAWPFMQDYQRGRVITFLFPDPQSQYGDTYNVNQAKIAIGSGGLSGQGYGHGTQVQLRFLKVRHTDFIFSAMAEEFGFIGAILLIAVLVFIVFRCLRAARNARDMYGSLICYGVAVVILFQSAFNIGMNLNLFPVSGLPIPFFSYGGSSLLSSLLGIGLVQSVILRQKKIEL